MSTHADGQRRGDEHEVAGADERGGAERVRKVDDVYEREVGERNDRERTGR